MTDLANILHAGSNSLLALNQPLQALRTRRSHTELDPSVVINDFKYLLDLVNVQAYLLALSSILRETSDCQRLEGPYRPDQG